MLKDVTVINQGTVAVYVNSGSAAVATVLGVQVPVGGQLTVQGYSGTVGTAGSLWANTAVVGTTGQVAVGWLQSHRWCDMPSQYPWSPGQNAQGQHVINSPSILNGLAQFQKGRLTFPPSLTAPGTIASGGTVANTTGYDAYVYAAEGGRDPSAKILAYNGGNTTSISVPGSVSVGNTATYFVPGPGAIAITYAGIAGLGLAGRLT